MEYVDFGKLGFKISRFGIGCMRLPQTKGPDGSDIIDEQKAIKMIRYGIDNGVNYIDTAYPYHGGESEPLVAKALKDGYREKVKLATKLPVWHVKKYEDFDKYLDEQLERLDIDYIDFYLMHALNKSRWSAIRDLDVIKFMDKAVSDGRIKYPSFSFHGELPEFKEIVDAYSWSMCQIQLNIIDKNHQAGVEGLKYAAEKEIPVVIMEPLKGGRLANNIPPEVIDCVDKTDRSLVDWSFRWLYDKPEVTVILSGVSNMDQLKDNLDIFSKSSVNCMNENEYELIKNIKEVYDARTKVGCTSCNYCMPCPSGVSIPHIFRMYNDAYTFNNTDEMQGAYKRVLIDNNKDASRCVECGKCEKNCPQNIQIIEKLKEADNVLRNK